MAATPNYSWPTPDDTDLVRDGALAIRDLGDAIDATVFGLPSGSLTSLASGTLTGASVTVTGLSQSYNQLLITWKEVKTAVNTTQYVRFNAVTSGYTASANPGATGGTAWRSLSTGAGEMPTNTGGVGNAGYCYVQNYATPSGSYRRNWIFNGVDGGTASNFFEVGQVNIAPITDVVFNLAASTFSTGTYEIYGVQ